VPSIFVTQRKPIEKIFDGRQADALQIRGALRPNTF
jgi:hypothetical protein